MPIPYPQFPLPPFGSGTPTLPYQPFPPYASGSSGGTGGPLPYQPSIPFPTPVAPPSSGSGPLPYQQLPNVPGAWGTPPMPPGNPEMPTTPPTQPSTPPGPAPVPQNAWNNAVNFAPINWMPEWFQTTSNPEERNEMARQFRESLGDVSSDDYATSMNEYTQYMTNRMLAYDNPLDAQRRMDALAISGLSNPADGQSFQQAYGGLDAGFNPTLGMTPGAQADAFYNSADRIRAIQEGFNNSNSALLGGVSDATGWTDDGITDPFEQANNWMSQVLEAGVDYGLDDGQTRRNRYEERARVGRLNELAQMAQSMGIDGRIADLGLSLINPSAYSRAQSPVAFTSGAYSSAPSTSSGYNANYGYRNTRNL